MEFDFKDRVVMITGGTGSLGRVLVKQFISANAKVVSTYVSDNKIQDVENENWFTESEFIKANVLKKEEVHKLVAHVKSKYSKIDILVNTVGGYIGGKPVFELEEDEWDLMAGINLKSAFLLCKYILPVMIGANYGKILHIASRSGVKSSGYDSAYAASKAGLIRFVESSSKEIKNFNININCILPDIIDTEQNRRSMPRADFSKWVKAEDLAVLIAYLCSDSSKVINGAAIEAYGRG